MYDRGIEAFLAIVSCRSISGAADLLNITQPAVSHRIHELEDYLGVLLIDRMRGSRQCDLTLAGETFLPTAELWSQAWREIQKIKSGVSVLSLKIGCVDSVSTYLLPKIYTDLTSHNPPVHLQIFTMRSNELYEKVERRELDAAFVLIEQRSQKVNVTPFHKESMWIVRPYPQKKLRKTINAKELDPKNELYINWGTWHQIWHDRIWGPYRKAQIELDTIGLIKALMKNPEQWALVPFSVLPFFKNAQGMHVQELTPKPPDRITYLITHRFPRNAAKQGIEILELLSRNIGYLEYDP